MAKAVETAEPTVKLVSVTNMDQNPTPVEDSINLKKSIDNILTEILAQVDIISSVKDDPLVPQIIIIDYRLYNTIGKIGYGRKGTTTPAGTRRTRPRSTGLVKEMGILLKRTKSEGIVIRNILAGLVHTITNVGTVAKKVIRVMGVGRSSQKRHLDIKETGPSLMREIRERVLPMISQGSDTQETQAFLLFGQQKGQLL